MSSKEIEQLQKDLDLLHHKVGRISEDLRKLLLHFGIRVREEN